MYDVIRGERLINPIDQREHHQAGTPVLQDYLRGISVNTSK